MWVGPCGLCMNYWVGNTIGWWYYVWKGRYRAGVCEGRMGGQWEDFNVKVDGVVVRVVDESVVF